MTPKKTSMPNSSFLNHVCLIFNRNLELLFQGIRKRLLLMSHSGSLVATYLCNHITVSFCVVGAKPRFNLLLNTSITTIQRPAQNLSNGKIGFQFIPHCTCVVPTDSPTRLGYQHDRPWPSSYAVYFLFFFTLLGLFTVFVTGNDF